MTEGSKRTQENPQNSQDLSNTEQQSEGNAKVKLSLYSINLRMNMREMEVAPCILNLGIVCRRVINFTFRPLYLKKQPPISNRQQARSARVSDWRWR